MKPNDRKERPNPHSLALAATFSPGERVRLLHSTETGRILQVYGNGRLLVHVNEIDMELEMDAREVVKAAIPPPAETPAKQQARRLEQAANTLAPALYFVIEPEPGGRIRYHIVNNTAWTIIFALFVLKNERATGRLHGKVEPASAQVLFATNLQSWDQESNLLFQLLHFHHAPQTVMEPKIKTIRLRAAHFLREKQYVPILEAEGILLDLLEVQLLRPADQRREMLERNRPPQPLGPSERLRKDIIEHSGVDKVVDLHLESLLDDPRRVAPADSLALQLEEFERCMSLAVANDLDEILFIHGVGQGRLRDALHERLGQYRVVRSFKLDDSGKYGQGATRVFFV